MILFCANHGILTGLTARDWPDEFDAFAAQSLPGCQALKKEYIAGPFPWFNQRFVNPWLARSQANDVQAYKDRFGNNLEIHFVAHSNGTDVALRTIKALAARGIATKTLIAVGSILEADVEKSGVAKLMRDGCLKRAVAYVSKNDHAVKYGGFFSTYGSLGRTGWQVGKEIVQRVLDESGRVAYRNMNLLGDGELITRRFDDWGHSGYFMPANREQIFNLFLRDCGLAVSNLKSPIPNSTT